MRLLSFLIFILYSNCILYSQNSEISVSGVVYIDSLPAEAAVIYVNSKVDSISGISGQDGKFNFNMLYITPDETVVKIKAQYFGFTKSTKTYAIIGNTVNADIYLESDITGLDEVVIQGSSNSIRQEANKLIFSINKKDYLKNAKAIDVLNNAPTVSYNENDGIKINGYRTAKIFVDGIEYQTNDLKTIGVEEVDKIEIIKNPSAKYGSEFSGGVLNIITKKSDVLYYKGYISLKKGTLLNSNTISPKLTLKTKKFILTGYFRYFDNVQKVDYSLERTFSNGDFYTQESFRSPFVKQNSGDLKSKYELSETSNLYLNGSYVLNDIDGTTNGFFSNNTSENVGFSNEAGDSYEQYSADLVYEKKINENSLFVKGRYLNYNKKYFFNLKQDNVSQGADVIGSQLGELTGEISYEIPSLKLFGKEFKTSLGSKFIRRKFSFEDDSFFLDQNIYSVYIDNSFEINSKLSLFASLFLDHTVNESGAFNDSYSNFLPTSTLSYKLNKKTTINLSYFRRVNRPGAYDLNNNEVVLNPGVIERGNESLLPQINNYASLSFGKTLKKNGYLSINTYYENTNDAILQSIFRENDFLIYSKQNIGTVKNLGMSLSVSKKLLGALNTNLTLGIRYNEFQNNERINSGATFYGNTSVSTKLFNDKLSLSFFGSTSNPSYDFVSRTTSLPYTSLNASTNIFKDKLNISIGYTDLFKLSSKRKTVIRNEDLAQYININSNYSNIVIGFEYNFGDTFNDRLKDKTIQNYDLNKN